MPPVESPQQWNVLWGGAEVDYVKGPRWEAVPNARVRGRAGAVGKSTKMDGVTGRMFELSNMTRRFFRGAGAIACAASLAAAGPALAADASVATQVKPKVTLPGGASNLTETHEDWTVGCQVNEEQKSCVFSQSLGNKQTGQRVLSIELAPQGDSAVKGALLTPFGLKLADGVSLTIDEKPFGAKHAFTTCVQAGCLVPVEFDAAALGTLNGGKQLGVGAVNMNGEPVTLNISLKGFTEARKRAEELMK